MYGTWWPRFRCTVPGGPTEWRTQVFIFLVRETPPPASPDTTPASPGVESGSDCHTTPGLGFSCQRTQVFPQPEWSDARVALVKDPPQAQSYIMAWEQYLVLALLRGVAHTIVFCCSLLPKKHVRHCTQQGQVPLPCPMFSTI